MKVKNRFAFLILLLCLFSGSRAEGLFTSLRNQELIGARPMAMGESFVAVADDINAIYWNPAGLPGLSHLGLNSMHANLFQSGVNLNYVSICVPGPPRTSFGVDWINICFDDAELTFGKNKVNFSGGYQIKDWLALGLNLKYIQMSAALDQMSQGSFHGWGLDLGLLWRVQPRWRFGLMMHDCSNTRLGNIAGPVYPRNLRLGTAYQPLAQLIIAADLDDRLHLGCEWWPMKKYLAIRAGCQRDLYTDEPVTLAFGFGLDLPFWGQRLRFDYAFTDSPTLLNTHRTSLSFLIDLFPRLVKIKRVEIEPVYASLYKFHSRQPIGQVLVDYKGKKDLDCTVSVTVDKYAGERRKNIILPARTTAENVQSISLTTVFNDSILDETDNIPLVADIKISYASGNQMKSEQESQRFNLFRRNIIDWRAGAEQAAAFITPDDPLIAQFSRAALSSGSDTESDLLVNGCFDKPLRLFNAVSRYGIRYQEDSYSPYSRQYQALDNIYYPAEVIEEKAGDCDDLSVLMAALLENANIPTALVSVPAHIFVLFGSDLHPKQAYQLCCAEDEYLVYDNQVWLPLETTWIGHSFVDAWQQGAKNIRELAPDEIQIIKVREAWARYEPIASVSPARMTKPLVQQPDLSREQAKLQQKNEHYLSELENQLVQNPDSSALRNKLAVTYCALDWMDRAQKHFNYLMQQDSDQVTLRNNLGNFFFLQGKLDSAEASYQRALKYAVGDQVDGIYLNLGLVYAAAEVDSMALELFARVVNDSTGYEKVAELLGIQINPDELVKSAETAPKKKITKEKVIQLTEKAQKKQQKKEPKSEKLAPLVKKGYRPEEKAENVFYWIF